MLPGYPKVMRHPAFVKGIPQEVPPKNYKGERTDWFSGTADRFPEVTVTNPDQQEWHESRGYIAVDGSSIIGVESHEGFQEYPKWLMVDGKEVLVNSVEEESEAMGHNQPGKHGSPTREEREQAIAEKPARKKPGPPKGYKRKPKTDHMKVAD